MIENTTAIFHAQSKTNCAVIHATTDDCVASFTGGYDANVRRSLFNGASSSVNSAVLMTESVTFSQLNATKNTVSATSSQISTTPTNTQLNLLLENAAKINTDATSQQDSAISIDAKTDFDYQQANPLSTFLVSTNEETFAKSASTFADLQQMIPLDKRHPFHFEDSADVTHIFSYELNKEMPDAFKYTPSNAFILENKPPRRLFEITENRYVASNPLEFNLIEETYNGEIAFDNGFNLGLIDIQPVTDSRFVFDSVSTYTPTADFIYAFTDNKRRLVESVQRGGYRLSNTVNEKSALKVVKKSCFKSEQAKTIFNHRQWFNIKATDPKRPPVIPKPNHVTITIPQKQVYQMQHSISVTLENLTPISVDGVKLTLDNDSFAWSFSCNLLDLTQLNLVKQPIDAPPVTLVITINGNQFKMLVEKITRNRSFAKNSISLSGRSLSALLSQPYEQPRSATQSDLMTVQQLAELELPNGWAINWTAATWNVTSGAFSYTAKTPIQVISEIAASIGAIVVPSRNAKVLNIMPRYTVLPWNFDATAPDLIIPDSSIVSLTYRNIVPTQANAVYVHGSEIGGVLSRCRLTGTDGARLSATVTNSLMTDIIGTRALGEKILADNYEQPAIQSVSLKLGGDYPLIGIGDFVRINIDNGQVRGVVNSVGIDATLDSVNQTIQLGAESANVWTQFKDILPSSPLLVGTVASVSGETSLMTLIDGGVIRCRGVGAIDEKWYIRNGALESKAPSLAISEIVV